MSTYRIEFYNGIPGGSFYRELQAVDCDEAENIGNQIAHDCGMRVIAVTLGEIS